MVAYSSIQVAGRFPVSGPGMGGRAAKHERGQFVQAVALTTADTVALFSLPPRARIVSGFIKADQLDSNGSPTITLNVGVAGTLGLFFNASTAAGRTAATSVDGTINPAGRDYITTAKTPVILTVGVAAATPVLGGTITVVLTYTVEEPA